MTMKYAAITALTLALTHGPCWAKDAKPADEKTESALAPTTDQDKVLYSLGYELGKDLVRQQLEWNSELVQKGVEDAIADKTPLINAWQRQIALKKVRELRAQENLAQSQTFLNANRYKEGIKALPSGLQYRVIKEGEGKTPGPKDSVRVRYKGRLIDGREFDSSYRRGESTTFRVAKVIKGWREGLQLMKEGGKWELYIPPELAYGKRGRTNAIPPNSALIFEVELLAVQ